MKKAVIASILHLMMVFTAAAPTACRFTNASVDAWFCLKIRNSLNLKLSAAEETPSRREVDRRDGNEGAVANVEQTKHH
jgi:hypothetical protein